TIMRKLNTLITAFALSFGSFVAGCATSGDDVTDNADDESSAPGSFDMWQSGDGWHFHLMSGNGRTLLTSEAYTTRTGALNGVLSVMHNGVDPIMYQVVAAAHGYMLHLLAPNNEVISFSQVYTTKSSATRAINSC